MKILLTAILILCAATAFAQTKKIRWTTELCEFEGTYDAAKHTAAELKNTHKLWFDLTLNSIFKTDSTAWKIEDVAKLSLDALDAEYESRAAELKTLDIIDTPYWETRRRALLSELEQDYRLHRVTLRAHTNPAVLEEYSSANACLVKYGKPLTNGGDELLATWRQLNEESRRKNIDPERIKKIFEAEYDSPDRLKYAQIEVMKFGWWNCAVATIDRGAETRDRDEEEFKKAFKRTREIGCDEP